MTTERTLRRKLHDKKKHKPYRKCPKCGGRMEVSNVTPDNRIFKVCHRIGQDGTSEKCWREELFYKGRVV